MEKLTVYYDRDVVRGQAFGNYLQGFGEVGIAAHNVKRSAWFKSWVIQVTVRTVPMHRPWEFVLSSDR